MPHSKVAVRVALVSVLSNTTLTVLKFTAAILSGSVSILSEGLHSSMDLVASVIAFIAVRVSRKPADQGHPWGHGKAENVSGVAEGLLIFVAAFLIVGEAVKKIVEPHTVEAPGLGIAVMAFSAVVNSVVSFVLYRTAKKTRSLALEADALHLKTDVYTSAGVAVGLILMTLTNLPILDPLVAILVALLIFKEAWHLVAKSFGPLLDVGLEAAERQTIEGVIGGFMTGGAGYHGLKARRSGHQVFVEFHLTMPGSTPLETAHALTERIEVALAAALEGTEAVIHMEPDLPDPVPSTTGET
jgi:cation diffusion facilitator family transporter